jgi:5'(3')-deoxyribonucleotidase
MIKIGLIGESPYDTKAIKHLLQQKYSDGFSYTILLKNISGDHLNTLKAKKAIAIEVTEQKPDLVVVIRDADALESHENAIGEKKEWYRHFANQIDKKSVLLLNVYELEALILADIEILKTYYQVQVNFKGSVSHQEKPKEYLHQKTGKKYKVSDCPDLFRNLRFETIRGNCAYFKDFILSFEQALPDN